MGTLPNFSQYSLSQIALVLVLTNFLIFALIQITPRQVQSSDLTFSATIFDNYYQPLRIDVTTGTLVVWTYSTSGKTQHTVTSSPQTNTTQGGTPLINSGPLNPGQSFSYTFNKHGLYPIQCAFHSFMSELVNVTGPDLPFPPITTPSTDYTSYAIGGVIAGVIVVVSVALFVRRRTKN